MSFGSVQTDLSIRQIIGYLVLVYPITGELWHVHKLLWFVISLNEDCVSSSINATVIKKNTLLIYEIRQAGY